MKQVNSKKGRLKRSALRCYYIKGMIKRHEISIAEDDVVTILGETQKGDKYAVQFDYDVFLDKNHDFNTGCNGKGELDRCLYIPKEMIEKVSSPSRRTQVLYAIL